MPTPKDDPLILTHLIGERADLVGWARENLAAGLTFRDLFALTPQQAFVTLFKDRPPDTVDELTALIRLNDERGRKGLPPLCPPWLKDILRERSRVAKPAAPAGQPKRATANAGRHPGRA